MQPRSASRIQVARPIPLGGARDHRDPTLELLHVAPLIAPAGAPSDDHSGQTSRHTGREGARQDRAESELRRFGSALGGDAFDSAEQDRQRTEISEAAEGIGRDDRAACEIRPLRSKGQLLIGQELVGTVLMPIREPTSRASLQGMPIRKASGRAERRESPGTSARGTEEHRDRAHRRVDGKAISATKAISRAPMLSAS